MTKFKLLAVITPALLTTSVVLAGGAPFTENDNLTAAINSNNAMLDVLINDNSGIVGDDFKEIIAVCDVRSEIQNCMGNSYSDGVGTVSINGTGNANKVSFDSNNNETYTFEFKYIMQNSANISSAGDAVVNMAFIEVNALGDGAENGCNASNCTLREAMTFAVNDGESSTINFNSQLNGMINLNSGLIVNSNDLSITGTGANKIKLSGNDLYRVITVPFGTERFSLSGLTISDGQTPNAGNGGGILIENALETRLENLRIINNSAVNNGGGIYAANAGLTLLNSEISNNSAGNNGGGFGITGGFGSDVTIENSTISSNQASTSGGGLYIDNSFGQTTTLKFVTTAFNSSNNGVDSIIQGGGNVIIEASVFEPGLSIPNSNNVTNNTIVQNTSGSLFGSNNRSETGSILDPALVEINNTGLYGHKIDTNSLAYNHVDDMVGVASCGNQATSDQFGNSRPLDGACDAGAYEYNFNDVIFSSGFE